MPKLITLDCFTTPTGPLVYGDKWSLFEDERFIMHCPGSGCPNPFVPSHNPAQPLDLAPFYRAYGWLQPAQVPWECVKCMPDHPEWGTALLLADGGRLATRFPDQNNGCACYATGCFAHRGFSDTWRGSKACLTFAPVAHDAFFSSFEIGENGILQMIDHVSPEDIAAIEREIGG